VDRSLQRLRLPFDGPRDFTGTELFACALGAAFQQVVQGIGASARWSRSGWHIKASSYARPCSVAASAPAHDNARLEGAPPGAPAQGFRAPEMRGSLHCARLGFLADSAAKKP
jgi:hypothetical protein